MVHSHKHAIKGFPGKIAFIICIMILSFTLVTIVSAYVSEAETIFNNSRKAYNSSFPENFIAKAEGKSIEDKILLEIPTADWLNPKKRPSVEFLFHKKYGQRAVVMGVDDTYENMFQIYIEKAYEDFSKIYDGKTSYSQFTTRYNWSVNSKSGDFNVIKMSSVYGKSNVYSLIYINKSTNLIEKIEQYEVESNKPVMKVKVSLRYQKKSNYSYPSNWDFWVHDIDGKGAKSISFSLTLLKTNITMSEDYFYEYPHQ